MDFPKFYAGAVVAHNVVALMHARYLFNRIRTQKKLQCLIALHFIPQNYELQN